MPLTVSGNINGPEGVYKTFGDLTAGEPFVYLLSDVTSGNFLVKTYNAKAFRPLDGAILDSAATDTVIAVNVVASVTV